jgi:hypothetical protein
MGSRQRRERRQQTSVEEDDFVAWWDTPEQRAKTAQTNKLLLDSFPELRESWDAELTDPEEDGPHVFYSFVFFPFLERALLNEPDDSPLLDRIFDFLRSLEQRDAKLGYLATVGVGEFLEDNPKLLRRAYPRLGPVMQAALEGSVH